MYKNKKSNNKNGITLIALIITIIVMLILVAVTVSMAINGGLFEKAGESVGKTQNEINKEQELANGRIQIDGKWYASIDDYLKGIEEEIFSEICKENTPITQGEYTAVIPKGFAVGISEEISRIEDRLVIQDKDGNQFVWIPVTFEVAEESEKDANGLYPEFLAVFYRSNWSSNARGTNLTTDTTYTEPYTSGYTTPEGKTESEEYYEMMRSVQGNKGFYIGRYEAGIKTTESPRTNKANGTSNMVVQRDCYPYNYVGWGLTVSNYIDDVTDSSKNQGNGALYLSKHMYDGKDIGAISTLCYGIQWDAMLDFVRSSKNVTSSKDWGNYYDTLWTITRTETKFSTDFGKTWTQVPAEGKQKTSESNILLTTGASDGFAAKNIYDVAGNVWEWTSEAGSSSGRLDRGGSCNSYARGLPTSYRNSISPSTCVHHLGFRPILYIKNS